MVDRRSSMVETDGSGSRSGFAASQRSTYDLRPTTYDRYDVVIAGASFAGLAVAQRLCPASNGAGLRGRRVLLVDKDPIGAGQTSACGAPLSIVQAMGAIDAVQQVHDTIIIHAPGTRAVWQLPAPFCTFDYRRFCQLAFVRTAAEFRQAAVLGRSDSIVQTAQGNFAGRMLVDATGWRAVLVGGPSASYVNRRWMAFGIETELECEFEPGLHFYFLPEVRDGYAWAFPCGGTVRFGVLSYVRHTKLRPALDRFVSRFGLRIADVHGGYLASGLRPPVVDRVFVVGDASGHCLPLTGEGIRTAVLAGFGCGDLLRAVLDGRMSPEEATAQYRSCANHDRGKFRALLWGNGLLLILPVRAIGKVAGLLSSPWALQAFMRHYLGIFRHRLRPRHAFES